MIVESVQRQVVELKRLLMLQPGWTVAAAESLTCGNVQAILGSVPGSSGYFAGGVTAYTLAQKVQLLRVDPIIASRVDSVAREVAEQMARGAAELFETDFGVATTGYAEPVPERGITEPCAWWAVCRRGPDQAPIRSGWVEFPRADRRTAQVAVSAYVIARLLELVAEQRGERSPTTS